MRILALDDEALALERLAEAIRQSRPEAEVYVFTKASQLLEFAAQNICDVAFLDIQMRGMTGVELAWRLKEKHPRLNIIFVTGYSQYAGDAMELKASGYVVKPITRAKVDLELSSLRYPVQPKTNALLRVKCFGNFDVYTPEGAPIRFERTKAKDLLAYLIYRSGAACSLKEISSAVFESGCYDKKQQNYMHQLVGSLVNTLKTINAGDVLVKSYNSLAINVAMVDCDYYRFFQADVAVVNTYMGEFMAQYSWAEFMTGYLDKVYYQM